MLNPPCVGFPSSVTDCSCPPFSVPELGVVVTFEPAEALAAQFNDATPLLRTVTWQSATDYTRQRWVHSDEHSIERAQTLPSATAAAR